MTEYRKYRNALAVVAIVCAVALGIWSVLILVWAPAQALLREYYVPIAWIGLALGLLASGAFLVLHRPSRWFSMVAVNSVGWVVLIFLLYLRSIISLALRHNNVEWRGAGNALNGIAFLVAIDLLLIYRVISFLQYRLTYRKAQRELIERKQAQQAEEENPVTYISPVMATSADDPNLGRFEIVEPPEDRDDTSD